MPVCWITLLILAGCAVGPNYKRPIVKTPSTFRDTGEVTSTNSFADLPWWAVFKDAALRELVRVALTNNYDLNIILARVDQARAVQMQARSQFMPQLDYRGDAARGRNAFLGQTSPNGGQTMNSFLGGFEAVWEIDLWGRVRRMNEAARANFMATQEGRRAVMISVVSGVLRLRSKFASLSRACDGPLLPKAGTRRASCASEGSERLVVSRRATSSKVERS